jgi:hypothetical protein
MARSTAGKFGEAFHADYSCSKTSMMCFDDSNL